LKKRGVKEEVSYSSNNKLDVMAKTMENLVEKLTLEKKFVHRE